MSSITEQIVVNFFFMFMKKIHTVKLRKEDYNSNPVNTSILFQCESVHMNLFKI